MTHEEIARKYGQSPDTSLFARLIDTLEASGYTDAQVDDVVLNHPQVDWLLILDAFTLWQFSAMHPEEDLDEAYYDILDRMNSATVWAHLVCDEEA